MEPVPSNPDSVPVLAVYGTLAPGESNYHMMEPMAGTWQPGSVRGHRFTTTWRTYTGFPGFIADPAADPVPVRLFRSSDLVDHWDELDRFEGPGYERRTIVVDTDDGPVTAQVYEVRLVAENSLALYGSLRPGGAEHHTISHLLGGSGRGADGFWFDAVVRGYQYEVTWGEAEGFDGFSGHDDGHRVPVSILLDANLADRWERLDHHQGNGFTRRPTRVISPAPNGQTLGTTSIYEANP